MISKAIEYNPKVYSSILKGVIEPYIYLRGGVKTIGQENLDNLKGPYILASTHQSMMDIPVLALVFKRYTDENIRFMAKKELWKYPIFNKLLDASGAVSVDRSKELQLETIDHIKSIFDNKEILGVFSQGTRVKNEKVVNRKDIKRGVGQLALMFGLDIVPVGIAGTKDKSSFRVSFGQPIHVDKSNGHDYSDHNLAYFRKLREINDRLYEGLSETQSLALDKISN